VIIKPEFDYGGIDMNNIMETVISNPKYSEAYKNEKWFHDSVKLLAEGRDALEIIYQLAHTCTSLSKEIVVLHGQKQTLD
jgi:hypothetical protein